VYEDEIDLAMTREQLVGRARSVVSPGDDRTLRPRPLELGGEREKFGRAQLVTHGQTDHVHVGRRCHRRRHIRPRIESRDDRLVPCRA